MRALCRQHWNDDDWRTRLDTVNADRPTTPEEMRAGYEKWTAAARAFLVVDDVLPQPSHYLVAVHGCKNILEMQQ